MIVDPLVEVESSSASFVSSYSSQNTLLECINKKTSFKRGGSKHIAITIKALIYMICCLRDNMPIRMPVERKDFIYFMKMICPLYKVPSRAILTVRIEEKYKTCRSQFKRILDQARYVSSTSDICTITGEKSRKLAASAVEFVLTFPFCCRRSRTVLAPFSNRLRLRTFSSRDEWRASEKKHDPGLRKNFSKYARSRRLVIVRTLRVNAYEREIRVVIVATVVSSVSHIAYVNEKGSHSRFPRRYFALFALIR